MPDAKSLHGTIAAVCPIEGVSVGLWLDKSTWRISFGVSATAVQKTAALAEVQAFDPNAPKNNPVFTTTPVALARLITALVAGGTLTQVSADAILAGSPPP